MGVSSETPEAPLRLASPATASENGNVLQPTLPLTVSKRDVKPNISSLPIKSSRYYFGLVAYTGSCFCFMFLSFNLAQSLVTTLHPSDGSITLAVLYVAYAVGCIFAPSITRSLGIRTSFVFAAAFYAGWVFCNTFDAFLPRILLSAAQGIFTGVLWVQQGTWLTRITEYTNDEAGLSGRLNGLFFTLFSLSSIFSNVLALVIFSYGVSVTMLLYVLTGISVIPILLFVCQPAIKSRYPERQAQLRAEQAGLRKQFHMFAHALRDIKVLLHVPYYFMFGLHRAFLYGYLGLYSGVSLLPYAFLAFGVGSFCGNPIWGKLFDRYAWKPLLYGQLIGVSAFYALFIIATESQTLWLYIVCGTVYGFADTAMTALIPDMIMTDFPLSATVMYSLYNLLFTIGSAVGFGIAVVAPSYFILGGVSYVMNVLSVLCFLVYIWRFQGLQRLKTMATERALLSKELAAASTPTDHDSSSTAASPTAEMVTVKIEAAERNNLEALANTYASFEPASAPKSSLH